MFKIDKEDLTIHVTRGDSVLFDVVCEEGDERHTFEQGDEILFKVYEKKKPEVVVIDEKFTPTENNMQVVQVSLPPEKTTIGGFIGKPVDYWYEISYKSVNGDVQTLFGYDDDGAKIFRLYPEGATRIDN